MQKDREGTQFVDVFGETVPFAVTALEQYKAGRPPIVIGDFSEVIWFPFKDFRRMQTRMSISDEELISNQLQIFLDRMMFSMYSTDVLGLLGLTIDLQVWLLKIHLRIKMIRRKKDPSLYELRLLSEFLRFRKGVDAFLSNAQNDLVECIRRDWHNESRVPVESISYIRDQLFGQLQQMQKLRSDLEILGF